MQEDILHRAGHSANSLWKPPKDCKASYFLCRSAVLSQRTTFWPTCCTVTKTNLPQSWRLAPQASKKIGFFFGTMQHFLQEANKQALVLLKSCTVPDKPKTNPCRFAGKGGHWFLCFVGCRKHADCHRSRGDNKTKKSRGPPLKY